jgi:hypothetical protein
MLSFDKSSRIRRPKTALVSIIDFSPAIEKQLNS